MTIRIAACAVVSSLLIVSVGRGDQPPVSPHEHFYARVLPVLRSKCWQCHGPDEQQANLRLDSREAALRGGEHGTAILLEQPDHSLLLRSVRGLEGDKLKRMPPDDKDPLSAPQIADLAHWIQAGAPWPAPALVLFDDEPAMLDALAEGGGRMEIDSRDRHTGEAALAVGPQRFAAKIAGWNFRIAEHPAPGEYRYLRFAWKKRGGGGMMFELANDGQWRTERQTNAAWSAGKNTTGWDAVSLAEEAPAEWTVVTRDLWQDRGDWPSLTVTGLCLTAIDGGDALIDSIVLGPTLESLDVYLPRDRDRARFALPQPPRPIGDAWSDPDNPVAKAFRGKRLDLWSLQPITRPELPPVQNESWVRTQIDRFILARLEAAKLKPSPEADARTIVRRLTYDLTGLPPTPQQAADFEKRIAELRKQDPHPGPLPEGEGENQSAIPGTPRVPQSAIEELADRLLASNHYGQRWGRHWLDVARYADTEGFERDEFRPTIYRYRDYVIRSFNADKPYDQFLREQLAGDELVAGKPIDAAAADALIATGFLRLGLRDTTAEIFEEDARARDQLLSDLANTTGEAFLGLTMSCCQCHDHKYDPLLQADHYRLRAFFAAVKQHDELPISTDAQRAEIDADNATVDQELQPLREQLESLLAAGRTRVKDSGGAKDEKEIKPEDALKALSDDERKRHDELAGEIKEIEKRKRNYDTGWCATDSGGQAPATHILFQGDIHQPRDEVPPGFLSIRTPGPAEIPSSTSTSSTGRRTALADWIVSRDNPLTARVMVNRIWQQHFGVGLVATPNDFGFSGARPTHPELLDWLAAEFIESGWSIKHMHRLIVTSAAYRQCSIAECGLRIAELKNRPEPDDNPQSKNNPQSAIRNPQSELLWRQNPRRLDAEGLRDALLAVSGRLLPVDSGPPRWPAIPESVRRSNPATLDDNGRLQNWYATQPEEDTFVRSVFLVQKRSIAVPFLQPFDTPDSSRSCGRRDRTIVAPQASTLMNSPFALAMAEAFAARVEKEAGDGADSRVRKAFELALLREPDDDELTAARELLAENTKAYADASREQPARLAVVDLCRALLNSNEFLFLD